MGIEGYDFDRQDLPMLLQRRVYPEQPMPESGIIRDWLTARGVEYERYSFSVRVGEGRQPDPDHLPGIQKTTAFSSRKRIDVIGWNGDVATIVEAKERLTTTVLGQLFAYRQLLLEALPDAPEPRLVAIGRRADPDMLRVLSTHGVDVFIYESAQPE